MITPGQSMWSGHLAWSPVLITHTEDIQIHQLIKKEYGNQALLNVLINEGEQPLDQVSNFHKYLP